MVATTVDRCRTGVLRVSVWPRYTCHIECPCHLEAATACSMMHTCHCSQVNTHKIPRLEEQRNRLWKAMIWFGMHETAVCSAGVARMRRHPHNDQGLYAVKVNTKGGNIEPDDYKRTPIFKSNKQPAEYRSHSRSNSHQIPPSRLANIELTKLSG